MSENEEDRSSKPSSPDDLDERLRAARARHTPIEPGGGGNALGIAFRLATDLVAGVVVGGFLGWIVDSWLGTTPAFLLIFFALGFAAGLRNVVRTAKQMNEPRDADGTDEAPNAPGSEGD